MNQEFLLPATPAVARRLLAIQHVCDLPNDDRLVEIAQRERITEQDFDPFMCEATPLRLRAAQFLLDCGLRAIVQGVDHPALDELVLLNTLRIARPKLITIVTKRSGIWKQHVRTFFDPRRVRIMNVESLLHSQAVDEIREGAVVFDITTSAMLGVLHVGLRGLLREFQQCIFYEPFDADFHSDWVEYASILLPALPPPLSIRRLNAVSTCWLNKRLIDLAPLYNVCLFPEFISDPKRLNELSDTVLMATWHPPHQV